MARLDGDGGMVLVDHNRRAKQEMKLPPLNLEGIKQKQLANFNPN